MERSELNGPSVLRAFAPVWLLVGLLVVAAVLLPVALVLLLYLADLTLRID